MSVFFAFFATCFFLPWPAPRQLPTPLLNSSILRCTHISSRHGDSAEAQYGSDHDGELHIY